MYFIPQSKVSRAHLLVNETNKKKMYGGISIEWLLKISILELDNYIGFYGDRKTGEPGEKPESFLRTKTCNKLNPHLMMLTPGIKL